jgi:diguanylate cyclase (GGDEF)-like protein
VLNWSRGDHPPNMKNEDAFIDNALTVTHAGAFEWNVQERQIELSSNLQALLGFSPGEFDGRVKTLLDILNPHDRDRILDLVSNASPDQTWLESEFRITGQGQTRWFSARGEVGRDSSGNILTIIGIAQEIPREVISERRMRAQQAVLFELLAEERIDTLPFQEALSRIAERSAKTLDVERVSIWTFSSDRRSLHCHVLCLKSSGRHVPCADLKTADFPGYFAALSQSRALAISDASIDDRTSELAETYLKPLGITSILEAAVFRKGEAVGLVRHEQVGPPRNWTLDEEHFAASVADLVTLMIEGRDRAQLLSDIEFQSWHDPLTGLPNRLRLRNYLEQRIRQSDQPFSLMLADLNQFKEINDTLGHEPGDEMLIALSRRLTALLPPGSLAARLGGDEFGMLIENPGGPKQLAQLAATIRHSLHRPVTCQGMQLAITTSVGASLFPLHGRDASTLMRSADVALHGAKDSDGYRLYDPSRDRHTPRRLSLMHDLINAVENDVLRPVFQPKMRIDDMTVAGLETLGRWSHPRFGEVTPDEYIPLAELSGLIVPLTLYMARLSGQLWKSWHDAGHDTHLAINLSPGMLQSSEWVVDLLTILAETGMPADQLELEVTENAFIHEPELALETMQSLARMGIRFSLDDFGMGYSSLAHLSQLPINTLKIDKSFVQNMVEDNRLQAIVHSTIQMGRNLGIEIVAEGVENVQMLDQLRLFQCQQAQGNFLCPPLDAEKVLPFLDRFSGLTKNGQ